MFEQTLLEGISKKLLRKNETIAVAESVTSGLLQFAFSCMPKAMQFFQGGITAYNLGQKARHLMVEPIHAQEINCVSHKVSLQMALEIAQKFQSDWGIGTTGFAAGVPESNNKVYAYFVITRQSKIISKGKLVPKETEPQDIQKEYCERVLQKLLAAL